MRATSLVPLLYILFGASLVASQSASTTATEIEGSRPNNASQVTPTRYCISDCGPTSICNNDGTCTCGRGFSAVLHSDGGSECVMTKTFFVASVSMRVVFSVLFFVQMALLIFRVFLEFSTDAPESQHLAPVFVTRVILVLLLIDVLIQFFHWTIDFRGAYGVGIPIAMNVIAFIEIPNLVLIFCVLLAYWIDFYHALVMKLRREQMLKKVNANYTANVSFEDIILQINRMRKVKAMMSVLCILSYGVYIATMVIIVQGTPSIRQNFLISFYTWFAAVWLVLGVGFLAFGIRLARVLPPQMSDRIKKLTRKVSIVAILLLINNIYSLGINARDTPDTTMYMSKIAIVATLTIIARFLWIDIYLPFSEMSRWANFTWSKASSQKTSSNDTHRSQEGATEIQLKVLNAQSGQI